MKLPASPLAFVSAKMEAACLNPVFAAAVCSFLDDLADRAERRGDGDVARKVRAEAESVRKADGHG